MLHADFSSKIWHKKNLKKKKFDLYIFQPRRVIQVENESWKACLNNKVPLTHFKLVPLNLTNSYICTQNNKDELNWMLSINKKEMKKEMLYNIIARTWLRLIYEASVGNSEIYADW